MENRVENSRNLIFKFQLFHFANKEIPMSRKFPNYIYHFEFSCSVFSCSQDKRVGITKFFHSILYPLLEYILITTTLSIQKHLFFSPSPSAPTMNLNILFLFNVL